MAKGHFPFSQIDDSQFVFSNFGLLYKDFLPHKKAPANTTADWDFNYN